MASQAVKDLKLGFWIGAGIFIFSIVLAILLSLAMKAFAE